MGVRKDPSIIILIISSLLCFFAVFVSLSHGGELHSDYHTGYVAASVAYSLEDTGVRNDDKPNDNQPADEPTDTVSVPAGSIMEIGATVSEIRELVANANKLLEKLSGGITIRPATGTPSPIVEPCPDGICPTPTYQPAPTYNYQPRRLLPWRR